MIRLTSRLAVIPAALALSALAALACAAAPRAAADPVSPGPIATFNYTGGPQVFTVPAGVTFLSFDVIGGRGGFPNEGGAPGAGGETIAGLDVTPGQELTIWVGDNAGGSGGWGYTCGGDQGIATGNPRAFDGGGGGGSSAVTEGAWTTGAGSCAASARPSAAPLIVGGGGGGGGGREHIPLTNFQGGAGGAGGEPAQAGFPGQGKGPSLGGCVNCGAGNTGGRGADASENSDDTMGGGGGGGGGYETTGHGGGGGGRLPSGNGAQAGGAGGAGGISYAAPATRSPIYIAGPLNASGVVTVSAVHQEGFSCTGAVQHPSFPAGVEYAHVTAEGAAGGTRSGNDNSAPPGKGGHGGVAGADLAGYDWNKLNVFVGCHGSDEGGGGGYGLGSGGNKGTASSSAADDAAGGGGGSGVEAGEFALVVAGGGGGGGGGAETLGTNNDGGDGGDGGARSQSGTAGHDGESESGGNGGCPGTQWRVGKNGGGGEGSSTASGGGGGGGGGGGWGGGCGGEGGNFPAGGGGGGGGGGSYVLEHDPTVTDPQFSTSTGVGTDGSVVFSYVVSTPSHLTVVGGSGQQTPIDTAFPQPLSAKVLDQEGRSLTGIPVTFDVVAGPANSPSGKFAGGGETATVPTNATGVATSPIPTANLQTGNWQVQATIGGEAAPVDFSLTNSALSTATSISASANPALVGQQVTFAATVKGPSGAPVPTGTIQFSNGGAALGPPVALTGGSAQSAPVALPFGTHSIEATYQPDEGFQTSGAKLNETVEKETSATTVTSSENPSGFGEAVSFTADVTPGPGGREPSGTVQFKVDGTALGGAVALSGGSATSPPASSLAVGSHEVEAVYSGDEFVAGGVGKLTQSVGAGATATTVTSVPNPAIYGQSIAYTATVTSQGADTPTGSVKFLVDGMLVCEGTLVAGALSCEPSGVLASGSHDVVAEYAGDPDFTASHGSVTQVVAKATTATSISADLESTVFGQPVTFTAAVSVIAPGGGEPGGDVQFMLGEEPLGAPVPVSAGSAVTPPITSLPVGIDAVSAEYLGDADHSAGGETLFEEVAPGQTTTSLTSSANPTVFGVPVTFTARVAPNAPAAGEPGGTVLFTLDGSPICEVAVAAGSALCQAPTLFAGEHEVGAAYSGEADFVESDGALTQSIVKVASHTVASTSASPAEPSQAVTLSAEVLGGLPGESPAGTVTFSAGATVLGTAPVHPTLPGVGAAAIESDALPVGTHQIVATYGGDAAIEPSASPPISQTVNAPLIELERPPAGAGPAAPGTAPAACTIRNVRARLFVYRSRDAIRLVARYRADASGEVTIGFSEGGDGKAARQLGSLTRTFTREGIFRVHKRMPAKVMKQLRRQRRGFAVSFDVAGSPGFCAEATSEALSVSRRVSGQRVWFQSDSAAAALPG